MAQAETAPSGAPSGFACRLLRGSHISRAEGDPEGSG